MGHYISRCFWTQAESCFSQHMPELFRNGKRLFGPTTECITLCHHCYELLVQNDPGWVPKLAVTTLLTQLSLEAKVYYERFFVLLFDLVVLNKLECATFVRSYYYLYFYSCYLVIIISIVIVVLSSL